MTVRVRFAPSPTGHLHIGGARTALYNFLFARHHGGTFILRSDDTDEARNDPAYQEDIVAGLHWLGLAWDEGVEAGGPHGPYRQSLRLDRYREAAARLVADGAAYHCFATPEQLEEFRRGARAEGRSPAYDGRFRLDASETRRRLEDGERAPIRFAVPRPGETRFDDVVRGPMRFDHTQVDDFVILRSDGTPTYHMASTVDDVDFAITHVIRGEDLLSSTPKHVLLATGLGAEPAVYAHLSLLMGPDGKKLSKRHGDTALVAYREGGYLPEAMVNYLALLGWSPGEDETVVGLEEMVRRFDLDAVSRNPAVFDVVKLDWMNGVYIRDLDPAEFVARTVARIEADLGRSLDDAELAGFATLAPLVQERAKRLTEVAGQVRFLYVDEVVYDEAAWAKVMTRPDTESALRHAFAALGALDAWKDSAIEVALRDVLARLELSASKGLQPVRVAVTGSAVSPPLFESLAVLGRKRTLERIRGALDRL